MKDKYINPYTDFGFKKLFGEEANKDLLIDFLNELLPEKYRILDLTFNNPENTGDNKFERKAIFDIYCTSLKGEKFIVEMADILTSLSMSALVHPWTSQKAKINFFKDRAIFYTSFPIRNMAEKGDWDFNLKPVFCIAVLDFTFEDENRIKKDYISNIHLKDQYCQIFYDKLNYILNAKI